jgi:hypothetical protein
MKQGRTLQEIGTELTRQRKSRKDFLADTRNLELETTDGVSKLAVLLGNTEKQYTVGPIAHQQIASRLQIPYRYYQKMQQEFPMLLDESVNGWFRQTPERRMVRVLDHNVRAFLSDRYRRLDHLELCSAVLPVIQEMKGAEITSCDVTDAHLYLKVINRKLKEEVAVGDVVQAGFVISNSEIGLGSLRVEPLVFRLVCKNGLIIKDYAQKKYHVGRQINEQPNDAYELYSDETLAQDDKAFFMKVQDIVRSAVDETKFHLSIRKLQEAKQIPLTHNPVEAVEVLADTFQLNQNERGDVLRQLFLGKDCSRYGLINAVTAASQLSDSYERATELERIGGELLAYPVPKTLLSGQQSDKPMRNVTPDLPRLTVVK